MKYRDETHRDTLTIAVAQPLVIAHDVLGNAEQHAEAVRLAASRVVVFPEMSLTGYELDAPPVDPGDERLGPLVAACADTRSVALAGAPVAGSCGAVHIGMFYVDDSGAIVAYRKMFLGGDETSRFAPGEHPVVVEVDGWRLGLAICKDTGIDRQAADTVALGVDLYVAGVLETYGDRDVQPARARRVIDNHVVGVAIASFAGPTGGGFGHTAGRSTIWLPDGTIASAAGGDPGEVAEPPSPGRVGALPAPAIHATLRVRLTAAHTGATMSPLIGWRPPNLSIET